MKERIDFNLMSQFLNKFITSDNLRDMFKLLMKQYSNETLSGDRGYQRMLILFLLYFEILSLDDIFQGGKFIDLDILECMVLIELDLIKTPNTGAISRPANTSTEVMVRDTIPYLRYGLNTTYRNIENIEDELIGLIDTPPAGVMTILGIDLLTDWIRVDSLESFIETRTVGIFKPLINFGSTVPPDLWRKARFVSNTNDIVFTISDTTKTIPVSDLLSFKYFSTLKALLVDNNATYSAASTYVKNTWEKIVAGTINYKEVI